MTVLWGASGRFLMNPHHASCHCTEPPSMIPS